MNIIEEEEKYLRRASYFRQRFGRCPALREENGEFYCSRMIGCEEYSTDDFIMVREPGEKEHKMYFKCKFIEK